MCILNCVEQSAMRITLLIFGATGGKVTGVRVACPRCKQHFCFDCDIYIHESLHNCPGCESLPDIRMLGKEKVNDT